jgi:hypothetical protein
MGVIRSTHVERGEVYTGFWWGNLRERDNLEGIKMIFRKWGVRAWTGSIWARIGTGGRHL